MVYRVFTTSSGSSVEQGNVTATGNPRLFFQSALYIYGLTGVLYESADLGFTLTDIAPAGISSVIAMCQPTNLNDSTTTIFTSIAGGTYATRYQKYPESVGSWSTGTALASGFAAVDALAGDFSSVPVTLPVAVGNSLTTSFRVERSDVVAPFTFVQSDAGLTASKPITDLAAVY